CPTSQVALSIGTGVCHYGVNTYVADESGSASGAAPKFRVNLDLVRKPSQLGYFGDSVSGYRLSPIPTQWPAHKPGFRHANGSAANLLYFDGHVILGKEDGAIPVTVPPLASGFIGSPWRWTDQQWVGAP